jgi:hypothetical protein
LSIDVTELYDKVEHWTRRDRVRKLRDGQEAAKLKQADDAPGNSGENGVKARKAALRSKLFGRTPKELQ